MCTYLPWWILQNECCQFMGRIKLSTISTSNTLSINNSFFWKYTLEDTYIFRHITEETTGTLKVTINKQTVKTV